MKYGTRVAFIHDEALRFGVIEEIITKVSKDGETTKYTVRCAAGYGSSDEYEVANSEDLIEVDSRYPSLIGGRCVPLFKRLSSFDWSEGKSRDLLSPPSAPPVHIADLPEDKPDPGAVSPKDTEF